MPRQVGVAVQHGVPELDRRGVAVGLLAAAVVDLDPAQAGRRQVLLGLQAAPVGMGEVGDAAVLDDPAAASLDRREVVLHLGQRRGTPSARMSASSVSSTRADSSLERITRIASLACSVTCQWSVIASTSKPGARVVARPARRASPRRQSWWCGRGAGSSATRRRPGRGWTCRHATRPRQPGNSATARLARPVQARRPAPPPRLRRPPPGGGRSRSAATSRSAGGSCMKLSSMNIRMRACQRRLLEPRPVDGGRQACRQVQPRRLAGDPRPRHRRCPARPAAPPAAGRTRPASCGRAARTPPSRSCWARAICSGAGDPPSSAAFSSAARSASRRGITAHPSRIAGASVFDAEPT